MNIRTTLFGIACLLFLSACEEEPNSTKLDRIVLSENTSEFEAEIDYSSFPLKPKSVLVTDNPKYRLVTIYKEKVYNNRTRIDFSTGEEYPSRWIDGDYFHNGRYRRYDSCNVLNGNFMPGLSAVWDNKMYNVAVLDTADFKAKNLFASNALINTLYFPGSETDTLNCECIDRNYYLVSVFDTDTNNDTVIDRRDLRKLYAFDEDGTNQRLLIPANYSVLRSAYDRRIDHMYVYARKDENNDGYMNPNETEHVFAIDLKNPQMGKRVY